MTGPYPSSFAAFIRRQIPNSDRMSLAELSVELGGLNIAMVSRLRAGSQRVGPTVARRIADHRGTTDTERAELFADLMATSGRSSGNEWSPDGAALFVEFRESPDLSSAEDGPKLRRDVAALLNRGLSYAFLLPPMIPSGRRDEEVIYPKAMVHFLNLVHAGVVDSFLQLRTEALRQLCEGYTSPIDEELVQKAELIDTRLKLFVLREADVGTFPAVGFRLFLKAKNGMHKRGLWDPAPAALDVPADRRLIDAEGEDEKDLLRAIEARFFPVLNYFDETGRLPPSDTELAEYAELLDPHMNPMWPQPTPAQRWGLYQPQEGSIEPPTRVIDRIFRRRTTATTATPEPPSQ